MDPYREVPLMFERWEHWLREAGVCESLSEVAGGASARVTVHVVAPAYEFSALALLQRGRSAREGDA